MTDEEKKERRRIYEKQRYQENREKKKAYYQANKEKLKANAKTNHVNNLEMLKAYRKAYCQANKEKLKAYRKAYYQANKEKRIAYVKDWADINKENTFIYKTKRRALKINKLHPDHDSEIERSLYILAKNCEAIFNEPFEIDHILPYNCGGWHHHENLQVIPTRINRQKHNNPDYQSNWPNFKTWRDLPEFLVSEKNF